MGIKDDPNVKRVVEIVAQWPEWKRNYQLTKYKNRSNLMNKEITIKQARETIKAALEADPGFENGYVANIAMLLHDKYGITDYDLRNQAAKDILELVFGDYYRVTEETQVATPAYAFTNENTLVDSNGRFVLSDLDINLSVGGTAVFKDTSK